MKLIIDIPEHIWEMVVNTGTFGCYRFNTSRAIRKGVPLEKIRAEIEQTVDEEQKYDEKWAIGLRYAVKIIDKYRGENKDGDSN